MSFPLVFTGVLMFVTIPGMSEGFYMAWAFVTYIIWGTLYSTVNIPYGSMVKCYINAYKDNEMTIKTVIDKIMGESEFKGTPNENVWCNKWQTRL